MSWYIISGRVPLSVSASARMPSARYAMTLFTFRSVGSASGAPTRVSAHTIRLFRHCLVWRISSETAPPPGRALRQTPVGPGTARTDLYARRDDFLPLARGDAEPHLCRRRARSFGWRD